MVNDPYVFGAIAAANALSDVYAMGGRPLTALAIIGFASCDYEHEVIKEILRGAVSTLNRVTVALMGGHSFEDDNLKFGLSITGVVNPQQILRVGGAQEGDIIALTKPLGIGILATALKGRKITDEAYTPAVEWMTMLNDKAAEAALDAQATAATDVTGFGLLGHAYNMVRDSKTDFLIHTSAVPVLEHVRGLIASGIIPEGAYTNLSYLKDKTDWSGSLSEDDMLLLSDPQTSGGLLITIPEESMDRFSASGVRHWVIGKVIKGTGRLRIT